MEDIRTNIQDFQTIGQVLNKEGPVNEYSKAHPYLLWNRSSKIIPWECSGDGNNTDPQQLKEGNLGVKRENCGSLKEWALGSVLLSTMSSVGIRLDA